MARLLTAAAALLAAAAVAASTASAETISLRWRERVRSQHATAMILQVRSLVFDASGWRVTASVSNRSTLTIGLRPFFALLLARTATRQKDFTVLAARSYTPVLPPVLKPGEHWTGTFGGRGASSLKHGLYLRVRLGYFAGAVFAGEKGFSWTTDNVRQL